MPEPNASEPANGVAQLSFVFLNKRKQQLCLHLFDGETLAEKGAEWVARWLQDQVAQHVQQEFGQGASFIIYDQKGSAIVPADILVSAILKDQQKGTATVQRYGELTG
jgi:hypothetical protein